MEKDNLRFVKVDSARFVEEVLFKDGEVTVLCISPENNEITDFRGTSISILSNSQTELEANNAVVDYKPFYRQFATLPNQTHSLNVKVVEERNEQPDDTDAVITFKRNLPVGVVTADCVPIAVYAPDVKGVGAIHAGWKGTLGGIVDKVLDVLEERGADLTKLQVIFGPSISQERYEVDKELGERFREAGFSDYVSFPTVSGKPHIDLQGVNMERFLRRGVKRENIRLHPGCSFDSRRKDGTYAYPSHRRTYGAPARMLTCVSLS